jgi:membrane protein required for colicin V production
MTAFDYLVIAIIIGSIIVALVRGLVAEVLSLTSWLLAFWCAKEFSPMLSRFLPADLAGEGLRLVAAFVLLFFLVWLGSALLRVLLTGVMNSVGLGGLNRGMGAIFGAARGLVLVVVLVLLGGLSNLPSQPMWQNALFAPPLQTAALSLKPWLPALLANNVRYP